MYTRTWKVSVSERALEQKETFKVIKPIEFILYMRCADKINCQHILIHLNLLILSLYLVLHTFPYIYYHSVHSVYVSFIYATKQEKSATIKFLERRKIYINYTLFCIDFAEVSKRPHKLTATSVLLYMFNELLLLHCSSIYRRSIHITTGICAIAQSSLPGCSSSLWMQAIYDLYCYCDLWVVVVAMIAVARMKVYNEYYIYFLNQLSLTSSFRRVLLDFFLSSFFWNLNYFPCCFAYYLCLCAVQWA